MKALLRDLNDPSKFKIEEVIGHTPINLVTTNIPQDLESADADLIDLETFEDEAGIEHVRAVVNEERRAAKEAARAQAEAEEEARQIEEEKIQRRIARMDFAKRFFAVLGEINDSKGMGLGDFLTLMSDPDLQAVKVLVETGALGSARTILAAYTSEVYSEEEIGKLITEIDTFLANEAGT